MRVADASGALQALDAGLYAARAGCRPGPRRPGAGDGLPRAPGSRRVGIQIDYTAGYGDAAADVPAPLAQAILGLVAQAFEHREDADAPIGLVEPWLAPFRRKAAVTGASVAGLRRLAVLSQVVETETAFGGRSRAWSVVGGLWIDLRLGAASTPAPPGETGARPTLVQTAEAEARDHPGAAVGQKLSVDGQDWSVVVVDRASPRPGRMILTLRRDA